MVFNMDKKKKDLTPVAADDTYRQIFDSVNDLILVHDPVTGEIIDANSKCLEIGFTIEQIRNMGVAGFSPKGEEYSPERIMHLIREAANGRPQLFEWGFYDSEGILHPTEVNLTRATIGGKPVLLAIVRDISDRKAAQQEIRHAKESFHNIVEKCTDGLVIVDENQCVRFANNTAVSFFSRSPKNIDGGIFAHIIETGNSDEIAITRLCGEPGTGEMRKTATAWEGKPAYLVAIRDVTEQKKLVEELTRVSGSISRLRGLLPICSHCKKIRDDKGYWEQIETYISEHSDAEFTHGLCPDCAKKYYPQDDDRHETGSLFP